MFTGIVAELGRVVAVDGTADGRRLQIQAPSTAATLTVGDSVAIDGVCLTAVDVDAETFAVHAVAETLERSTLGRLTAGDAIDLERPTAATGLFDGHIVQGHVDGVGRITKLETDGDARRVRVDIPGQLSTYVVEKGSITVDGVSLTITAVSAVGEGAHWVEFILIPYTLEVTVLGTKQVGDGVNVEVDVLAKYVERMLEARR